MKLLHYGLQRSGTNYLETILKKNYNVRFLNSNKDRGAPIQKHFRLYDRKDIVPEEKYLNSIYIDDFNKFEELFKVKPEYYLVISKDPYSWYLSYQNWAKKCNWPSVNHHYIEEYNLFYGKFLELSKETNKIIFLRYIDMIKDTSEFLENLEIKIGIKKKLFKKSISRIGKVSQSSDFTPDKIKYYLNESYLEEYTAEEMFILNRKLDKTVVELLGYEVR